MLNATPPAASFSRRRSALPHRGVGTRARAHAHAHAHTSLLFTHTHLRSRVVSDVSRDRDTASDVAAVGPIPVLLPRCGRASPTAPSEAPPPRTTDAAAGAGGTHRIGSWMLD